MTFNYTRQFPFTHEQIFKLVKLYGSPLQLYDEAAMTLGAKYFMETFSKHIDGFQQFFAVKALPNPNILKILTDLNMGLDCSSASELKLAQLIGLPGNRIMFTSNSTSLSDLKLALEMGVIINLDDSSTLDKIQKLSVVDKLFFRFNPGIGHTDSETNSNVLGGPNAKFGMDQATIIQCIQKAKSMNVKQFGIHVMTGSNVTNISYWTELIDKIFELLNDLAKLGIVIDFVNLGGGIGLDYKTGTMLSIELLAKSIKSSVQLNSDKYGLLMPKIFMENGRFITGPYGYLITKCNVVKELYGQTFYGMDACMANLMRPGMYSSYHHILVLTKNTTLKYANVVGGLCENNDWFAKNRLLNVVEEDDLIAICDAGAHSHSLGNQYNGKLRAPEILVNGDIYKLIRRGETFEDYISTVIFN
jgi:diaminopimelate decarboxylase